MDPSGPPPPPSSSSAPPPPAAPAAAAPAPPADGPSGHAHGLSIGQLVDGPTGTAQPGSTDADADGDVSMAGPSEAPAPAPAPAFIPTAMAPNDPAAATAAGTGMDIDGDAVRRSEDGLRQLADAIPMAAPVEGAGASGEGGAKLSLPSAVGPAVDVPPTNAPAPTPADPVQAPAPAPAPLLNPLQTDAPPPSSTLVEPSRSPGPISAPSSAIPPAPAQGLPIPPGPSGLASSVVSLAGSPAPPSVGAPSEVGGPASASAQEAGQGLGQVNGVNGGPSEGAGAGAGTGTPPIKRPLDGAEEAQGDEGRYAKRAREDAGEGQGAVPSMSAVPAPSPAPSAAPVPSAVASPAPAPPAVASPAPAPPAPAAPASFPPVDPSLPPQYRPGTFVPPPCPTRNFPAPMTHLQHKSIMNAVRGLKKTKDCVAFLAPVDPVALNIPHYPTFITRPMDLSTVEIKLFASNPAGPPKDKSKAQKWDTSKGTYGSVDDVIADVRQIWDNTYIFNGPTHPVSLAAKNLEEMFERAVDKVPREEPRPPTPIYTAPAAGPSDPSAKSARRGSVSQSGVPIIRRNSSNDPDVRPKREIHPPTPKDVAWEPSEQGKKSRKRPDGQMKWAISAVNEISSPKYADCNVAFLEPVNPTVLGIPDYFQVIKRPMDLGTIKSKLASGAYDDVSEVNKDMKLMFNNCYTYNPPNSPVNIVGKKLEAAWNQKWKQLPPKEVPREESDQGSIYDAGEDDDEDEEIQRIVGEIAALQRKLDNLRKNKSRSKKARLSGPSRPPKASASGGPSKPKAPKNGHAGGSKPRKSGGANGASNGKVRRESVAYDDEDDDEDEGEVNNVTLEQKQELAEKIQLAGEDVLTQAITIIQETTSLGDNGEEIELDIDALPSATVVRLYNLVVLGRQKGSKPPKKKGGRRSGGHGFPAGTRKKVNDEHEAERIRRMEEQLASFHGGNGAAGGGAAGGNAPEGEEYSESEDDSEDE